MRIVLALSFALALPGLTHAQTQSYFLHHSAVPVTIPGGSTTTFLDDLVPTEPLLATAEEQILPSGNTGTFSTFIAPAFGSDTTLLPIASVRVNLSANQKMRACATLAASLSRLDASGTPTAIGSASIAGVTVAQGKSNGTVATDTQRIEFGVTDPSILTGQSIAVTASITNACNANRRVFFSYDAQNAAAQVRFQCCFTTAAKCAEKKIKAVGTKAYCFAKLYAAAIARAEPTDPAKLAKCSASFDGNFTKAEAHGSCPTVGDAAALEVATDALTTALQSALAPLNPLLPNKCQSAKLKAAGQLAQCLSKFEAKAAGKGQFLEPDPVGIQKCHDHLTQAFSKAEAKLLCDTVADAATIDGMIDAFANGVASQLACPCPP
jgi:hypothetical protein